MRLSWFLLITVPPTLIIGGAVGAEALGLVDSGEDYENNGLNITLAEQLVHDRVNDVRESNGLEPLEYHSGVADDARGHSLDMAERDYFAHDTPERRGILLRYPEECQVVGENIARTYWRTELEGEDGDGRINSEVELAESVVEQWMNSPGHRENMLSSRWASEGIGIARDGSEIYVTQGFCN
jgi:uncharacterized protein YkwD